MSVCLVLTLLPGLFAAPPQSADTLRVLAIRVAFQVDDATTTTGDGTFDLGTASGPFQIDPPPHNRSYFQDHLTYLKNYFAGVSRGRVFIEGDVFPLGQNDVYTLDAPMTDYNPNTSATAINQGLARLLRDALMKADADPAIDFSRYDSFIIFHAGVGRDIDLGLDSTPQDIASLFITRQFLQDNIGMDGIPVDDGAVTVRSGIILPETESQDGIELGLNGIMISNFGSQLGWLDLFSPDTRRSGVGRFGLMDAGLFNGDGLLPSVPMAWTRMAAGWETPQTIYQAQADVFQLHQALSTAGVTTYRVPINEREYFLLENRNAGSISLDSLQFVMSDARGELVSMREVLETHLPDAATFSDSTGVLLDVDNFDRGLPGGGVLIWHIDESIIDANRATNRINADPGFRGVDLEEADGSQDIGEDFTLISGGAGSEIGTALDPWYRDNNAPLFTNDPAGEFSLRSIPNSRSNASRANSHIAIRDFSPRDTVMSFRVTLNIFQPNFPRSYDLSRYGRARSLKAADVDGGGSDELIIATGDNKVLLLGASGSSLFSGDTLQVAALPAGQSMIHPPVLFAPAVSEVYSHMGLVSREGGVWLYQFNGNALRVDSLFAGNAATAITTFPVADISQGGANRFLFGAQSGGIFALDASGGMPEIQSYATISGALQRLHFGNDQQFYIAADNSVFVDGQSDRLLPGTPTQPVGEAATVLFNDSHLLQLTAGLTSPEDGVFRFDSDAAVYAENDNEMIAIAGNNRVYLFNGNLTMADNFPRKLYAADRETRLTMAPLIGYLPNSDGVSVISIVVADPAGLIVAYDLQGNALPDFPLSVGDSLAAAPVLLDIDGDNDVELACVTVGGVVYAWDFYNNTVNGSAGPWTQQYGNPQNSNRVTPVTVSRPPSEDLMPAASVYNWPNPNDGDFTFIRYKLNLPAEVTIRIYDLAGDLVKTFDGPGLANTDNEVRWELGGVQSGVYFGRVEALGNNISDVKVIKIAVVK